MVFARLPQTFFSPLASPNRRHYAELLLIYYRLFLEFSGGVERELVVARYVEYFTGLDPDDRPGTDDRSTDDGEDDISNAAGDGNTDTAGTTDSRWYANHFLRRLIGFGWLDEEQQRDFRRFITMKAHARPFFEALDATDRGAEEEYESHIVAVYSSLSADAAESHGEHAVLNAYSHTRRLVESLRVLEQNIRTHVQALFSDDPEIPDILHRHYDVYMHEVVDRAYTRLKTSDNLSRYRPRIARAVRRFLDDRDWLQRTAERLAVIQRVDQATARARVQRMLTEIKDDLASIDPILESIDDRNRRYSRISTERIRARLHTDATIQGRIGSIVERIVAAWRSDDDVCTLAMVRTRFLSDGSLYTNRARRIDVAALGRPVADVDAEATADAEYRLRVAGQLNPRRVAEFVGAKCRRPGESVAGHELVSSVDDYVRLLYAAGYAERRSGSFPFRVEWGDGEDSVNGFVLPRHRFVREHPRG